ncbi:MAG: hypothetical protein BWX88_02460 [Planctomycetes bacterium ADurb.Bin126]|nr:MAG: hypothetical protein BWX88_02460 [Planctomycetes bacterium ADurb.Bin126]HOD81196.1 DUF4091 domain-containing protein [Phycisphaerae bacterium]HQL72457.1 DUF4091 domain-containing protein [Phycisphaerae bacterium]
MRTPSGWLLILLLLAAPPARGAPLDLFAVSDAVRVFEDGYALPREQAREVRVLGLQNEVLSAQFVIRANEDLQDVTIQVGPLRCDQADSVLPPSAVRWNFVDGISIRENTPKLDKRDLTRPAPAVFPDVLSEDRRRPLAKGTLKAVYLTIAVPRDAKAGEYRGEVAVRSARTGAALPLALTVCPLALSDQRHLMVAEWFSTHRFKQHHGIDPRDQDAFYRMLGVYAKNMAEHRQNVFRVSLELIRCSRGGDGKLELDFSAFDRWAEVFWSTGRMDLLETGFVARFGEGGWSSPDVLLRDFGVRDASGKTVRVPGKEFLPEFLPALVEHLRRKKWLDKTVFHISDEPSNHNIMAWREASDFVHRCAPQLRRIDAIETPHCLDRLEVWVPKLDHLATWSGAFEDAQRRGNEMWFYTVGIFQKGSLPNKTVDVPLIDSRIIHWINCRYALKGYLHWGLNAWSDDPIADPGKHRGDGWHVYPAKGGLLNSLRWEQMRNGLQDYECLWLLEDRIAKVKTAMPPRAAALIDPHRRSVEIASQVVRTYDDCSRDPAVLYAARRQAIEETIALDAEPHLVVQTNPMELSTIAGDSAVDVHGWVQPGTTVKLNGRAAPVADDGLFLAQTAPSREGTITVEATRGQRSKTLVRKFKVALPQADPK